jgi:pyridoxal phosphate enzyme (YggS family)
MESSIAQNISVFKESIPKEVELIAVSKTKPIEDLQVAYDAGQRHFGENRIQEMAEKAEQLPEDIKWHMIGHVQGNKIKYMAPFVHLVHGIDKAKRLKELNKEAKKNDRVINCLLQIHIAKEETKFGFSDDEALEVLKNQPQEKYPNVAIKGLMAMATNTQDEAVVKAEFKGLQQLFVKGQEIAGKEQFNVLSAGMSGDYKIAIGEGANMIRIGSSIFGER